MAIFAASAGSEFLWRKDARGLIVSFEIRVRLMMLPGTFCTTFHVSLCETARLHELVREFGANHGVPEDAVFVVILSLDELMTNIVTHGCERDPRAREIVLRLCAADGRLSAEIEDDGCAFNPLDAPEPDLDACVHDRDLGGLGIHLARSLLDHVCYSRVGQRNLLTLTKLCS